jgi:Ca2+-binding EF-hand superfamily protein
MKRSIISLLVAGLFAGTATVVFAADNPPEDVKAAPKQAETSQSRSSDPNTKDAMNDTSKDAKQDKNTSDKSMQNQDKMAAAFNKADKDHDGTLDRKEAKKFNKNAAKNFDAIDTDKDGTISMDEVNTYMAAHPGGKKGNM